MDATDPNFILEPLSTSILGLTYPRHFNEWGRLSAEYKRLLVIASRDHGKSTFFDLILPISRIVTRKKYGILLVSYSDSQVLKLGAQIKSVFESKPKLKEFSPKSEDDWSKSRMVFKDGSVIETLTFGSSGRGGHYDLILVDDPVKDFGGMDPDEQSRYFTRALTPMCKPDGQIIVTGNYVYDNDLIDRVERNKEYVSRKFPAISNGVPLWPEYWSLDKLQARRKEIEASDDPLGFMKEYLLEKIDPKAQFFKRSMFAYYDPLKIHGMRMSKVISMDPAISLGGDDTAIVCTGTGEDKKTYVLEVKRLKTDDVKNIVDELFGLVERWQVPYIQLETIGFQKLFKHWIYEEMRERKLYFGIEEVKTHKKSKEARIMALQPRINSGSLLFHPIEHEDIITQFCAFPRGQHDDMIDALSFQVGKWDNPGPVMESVPTNSFEWWKNLSVQNDANWKSLIAENIT